MLKIGVVTNINPITCQIRAQFAEDNILSPWLPVLQSKTMNDKFFIFPDIGEQVACLMDENAESGVVLGAIYSDVDTCPATSKNQILAKFEDGSFVEYNKESGELTFIFKKINFICEILHNGILRNSEGIISNARISDNVGTMQEIREIYNSHAHQGNQGQPTSTPDKEMG